MNAAERKELVQTIHERVVSFLGPYGILVEHALPEKANMPAVFTLKLPDPDKSKPGVYSELEFQLLPHELQQMQADPSQLDCLPRAWARICAEWVPNLFDEAKLPTADGVDWRPQETLPEDFYAA